MLTKRILTALVLLLTVGVVSNASAETYQVKHGNNLVWIARQNNVSWQQMLLANETMLRGKYDEVCDKLSDGFRKRTDRRDAAGGGNYYCNDGKLRPYGNTLRAGWTLEIPSSESTVSIDKTVMEIKGDNIALVIDDTGSMSDKRRQVANFYLAALKKQNKISSVYLFADGKVRTYEAGGVKDLDSLLLNDGGIENTHSALIEAAKRHPDAIILLTDEQGDDWSWEIVKELPPVIAHCLPTAPDLIGCQKTLPRLARETKGRYIWGFNETSAQQ